MQILLVQEQYTDQLLHDIVLDKILIEGVAVRKVCKQDSDLLRDNWVFCVK